jgi:hypothetical protein
MHSQNTSNMEVRAAIGVYRNGVVYQLGILVYIRHHSVRCLVPFELKLATLGISNKFGLLTDSTTITTDIEIVAGLINIITYRQVRVSYSFCTVCLLRTNYKPTSHAGAWMCS